MKRRETNAQELIIAPLTDDQCIAKIELGIARSVSLCIIKAEEVKIIPVGEPEYT